MMVPTFIVRDLNEAIGFYTGRLDFSCAGLWPPERPFYAVLTRGADELHLTLTSGRSPHGQSSAIVVCADVDAVFAGFLQRGLAAPTRADSPVHVAPLDQTWGTREVYVDDPSGNTLCFQERPAG